MAETLNKTHFVSSCNYHKQQHHLPNTCCFFRSCCASSSSSSSCAAKRLSSLKLKPQVLRSSLLSSGFHGKDIVFRVNEGIPIREKSLFRTLTVAQMGPRIGNAQKWWEKGLQHNMREITSVQDLVGSLFNLGDKLVILDFFSPGCGGCRALHPKICQMAQMNPDVQFLQVNYEEHKSMCYSLNVHVLPFFRFYRGAQGRLCSFSCTNATIKKFKDALAKHAPDRCSLGPTKGLEEKELLALSANKDLSFTYTPKPVQQPMPFPEQEQFAEAEPAPLSVESHSLHPTTLNSSELPTERILIVGGN